MSTQPSPALHWEISGKGPDLVLIHGWGMNAAVWQQSVDALGEHFRVHTVDLPGYGHSHQIAAESIDEIAQLILADAPQQAIWLGWSLGGLIATHIAIQNPQHVSQLVTLASSPKFAEARPWRGIKPAVLSAFTEQLVEDFQSTIERFMALQAMGSPSARADVKLLKQAVLSRPSPNPEALKLGLGLLADVDYRQALAEVSVPVSRWYGRLDGLVPVKVERDLAHLDQQSFVFKGSSHAPFITEAGLFVEKVVELKVGGEGSDPH